MGYWSSNAHGALSWDTGCDALLGGPPLSPNQRLATGLGPVQWQAWRRWLAGLQDHTPAPAQAGGPPTDTLLELTFQRPDGQVRHLAARAAAFADDHGPSVAGVFWDQTAQRESSQQMAAAHQNLQQLSHQLLTQEKALLQQMARHLHDHLGQTLTALRFQIEGLSASPDALQRVKQLAVQASQQVRQTLTDLRPPLLDEGGLVLALEDDLEQMRQKWSGQPTKVLLQAEPGFPRLPAAVEYALFMVAREAVFNALQHSGATHIEVRLRERARREVELHVIDDGLGLPAQDRSVAGVAGPGQAQRHGHLGLVTMHERAHAIGARLKLQSRPGGGLDLSLRWNPGTPQRPRH